ncbi:hypothetical protein EDB92DRAFT_1980344 [Lactarius akahatsu]|uniref:C2 domain-containing protein n=1 Tax=Lactarius akahatsu TaxID=416441 RepID=A0AAD4LIQ0_9AGAM|nr:hypothetical protein EDB92DRAFT_1980344 [Lactarius akahatsu]
MAAAQDLEHGQMFSNSQSPPPLRNPGRGYFDPTFRLPILGQEPSLDSPRDAELQGGPSQLRVDVTVLRAHNIPRLKNVFGLKFFVTVAGQAIEMRTPSVPAKRRTARWGESLGTLSRYPYRRARDDTCRIPNRLESRSRFTWQSLCHRTQLPVRPSTPSIIRSTRINGSPSGEAEKPSVAQEFTNPTRSTIIPETLSPPTDNFPRSEISTLIPPAADRRGVSPAVSALHGAGEAMATINLSNKWEGALGRIKWVMDTVNPVAEVRYIVRPLPILDQADFCP